MENNFFLIKIVHILFFRATWSRSAASGGNWRSLSQLMASRNSLKRRWPQTSYFSEKHLATEVAPEALGEEWEGCMVESVQGKVNKASPWSKVSWPMAETTCCWVRGITWYRLRRTGKRKHESVHGYIVDANPRVLSLVLVKKGKKEDIPGLTDIPTPCCLRSKRAGRTHTHFSPSKEDDVC